MSSDAPILDIQLLDRPVEVLPVTPFPEAAGAECVFLGRTRVETHPRHGRLLRLRYEAYPALALKVLADLAIEVAARHACLVVRIHHACGEVPAGEASVLIQVVTGHRGESFDACRELIDALKLKAPIWKCQEWADGSTWSQGCPVEVDP